MTSLDRDDLPRFLTTREVTLLLRVNRSTLDRWVARNQFVKPVRMGGAVQRFERDEVLAFLAASKSTEPMKARQRKNDLRPAILKTRRAAG